GLFRYDGAVGCGVVGRHDLCLDQFSGGEHRLTWQRVEHHICGSRLLVDYRADGADYRLYDFSGARGDLRMITGSDAQCVPYRDCSRSNSERASLRRDSATSRVAASEAASRLSTTARVSPAPTVSPSRLLICTTVP